MFLGAASRLRTISYAAQKRVGDLGWHFNNGKLASPRTVTQLSSDHLKGQRDALAATDAHRDDASLEAVPSHRMQKTGR